MRVRLPQEKARAKIVGANVASWFSVENQYDILELECSTSGVSYRLIADDGTPILEAASTFEIVDGTIPVTWVVTSVPGTLGGVTVGPAAWSEGFWIRFFDGDERARELFEECVREMYGPGSHHMKSSNGPATP